MSQVVMIYAACGVAGMGNKNSRNGEVARIGHGAGMVATASQAAGYDTDFIDLRLVDDWEEFRSLVLKAQASVYGLSATSVDWDYALRAAQIIKETRPEATVIVGGIGPTLDSSRYLENPVFDYVVINEGEISFPKLVKQCLEGKPPEGKLIVGEKPNLDELPFVNRELFDYKREMENRYVPNQPRPVVSMLAGRGCPYACAYCQPAERQVFGLPIRMRSPQNVIAELRGLKAKYNFKSVNFWDDTFTINPRWVMEFCDLWEKEKFGAVFTACCRADIITRNEPMVHRMKEVGLSWFQIGYESGSQRVLDFIKKGVRLEQNYQAAEICRRAGVYVLGTFMLGLPTETNAEAAETVKMILEIKPDHPTPFYFLPIPGTDLYTYCVEHDLILDKDRANTRTGMYTPTIKGVDYAFLDNLRRTELSKLPWIVKAFVR